jgi:hypothetical protein
MIIEIQDAESKSRRDGIINKIYDTPSGLKSTNFKIYNHVTPTGS